MSLMLLLKSTFLPPSLQCRTCQERAKIGTRIATSLGIFALSAVLPQSASQNPVSSIAAESYPRFLQEDVSSSISLERCAPYATALAHSAQVSSRDRYG